MGNLLFSKEKRPNNSTVKLKKELLQYLKEEAVKQHYPSRREIEKTFHLRLDRLTKNINSLYEEAELKYHLIPNQAIKETKANLLLNLILKNLNKFNLDLVLVRGVRERGVDIITKTGDKRIGIEIKAYNQNEKLKQRDINQAERFIINENLDKVLIITSTNFKDKNLKSSKKILILNLSSIVNILGLKNNEDLKFILEKSTNVSNPFKNAKRQQILDYVLNQYKKSGKKPGSQEISKNLHVDIRTYFQDLFEMYKILRIPPPLKNMRGKNTKMQVKDEDSLRLWKEEFKKFILCEINKGNKYPSGVEIGRHFGISHIWNITKVSELYKELGLKTYLERKKKLHSFKNSNTTFDARVR